MQGETKYHVISLLKSEVQEKWDFNQLRSQLCTLVKPACRFREAGKPKRVQTQMQINNVLAGHLWWSLLHLHSANVHKALVWHAIYLFMHVSSFLNAYFNNREVTSERREQVLKQPLSECHTE